MPRLPLVGKTILIGLTYFEADGTFIEQKQMFGTIKHFDKNNGVSVELEDGGSYSLPPDSKAIAPAKRGEYHLRASGKIVKDPDYLCTYTITKPVKH